MITLPRFLTRAEIERFEAYERDALPCGHAGEHRDPEHAGWCLECERLAELDGEGTR